MPVSAKGSRRERELLDILTKEGHVVHRVAGSGTGENAVCDLVAVKDGKVQFIECKSRKKVYYPKGDSEQLSGLIEIAKKAGAKPILAVKINYRGWQFFDLCVIVPKSVN